MPKKSKKQHTGVCRRFLPRLMGLLLIVIALSVFLALLTFHPSDSAMNLRNDNVPQNLLGSFGAALDDLVLSSFGLVLPLFLLGFFVWGVQLLRHNALVFWKIRVTALILGAFAAGLFINLIVPSKMPFLSHQHWGGELPWWVLQSVSLQKLPLYALISFKVVLFILAFLAWNLVLGITYQDWVKCIKYAAKSFKLFFVFIGRIFSRCFKVLRRLKKKENVAAREKPVVEAKSKVQKSAEEKSKATAQKAHPLPKAETSAEGYVYPDINLLSRPKDKGGNEVSEKELDEIARHLETVLQEFSVNGKIVRIRPGPVVTLYELEPAPGTKTARVIGLADDIARSMSAVSVRIAVVPGSNTIGIELPNLKRETVWLKDLLEDPCFRETKNTLNIVLGKDIGGKNTYADLAKMPHLLVAGTTGSGKSVGVNSMILSLLFRLSPEECKLIMIDPKMLEFSMYNGIPHLLTPVITDPAKAVVGLKWAVREMEDRYRKMAQLNVRNIAGYNQKLKELRESGENVTRTIQVGFDPETGKPLYEEQPIDTTPLPYIVIVVDEMADLMLVAGKEVEAAIQRLAQMARAAGLHLIMSTQRPSVDVITGTIKANFPSRISFQVTSKIDSRTILGEQGAEQLLGMGDMLYMPAGLRPLRVHGSFVKDSEVEAVVEFLKAHGSPHYIEEVTAGELSNGKDSGALFDNTAMGGEEDLYAQAVAIVRNDKKASTSYIQRRLRLGYNRAAALIDRMEEEGIVSAADHVGRREVIG